MGTTEQSPLTHVYGPRIHYARGFPMSTGIAAPLHPGQSINVTGQTTVYLI